VRIAHPDGSWTPVSLQPHAVESGDGNGALGFILSSTDRRTDMETRYQHERNYLRALLEHVDVGIVACSASGEIVLVNPAFAAQHERPPGEATIQNWARHFKLLDGDGVTPLASEESPLLRALNGDRVHNFEYAALSREGDLRLRRANGTRIVDSEGEPMGAVVALHDITDQRRAEGALRKQALHDALTGLPNRALILDRLDTALARGRRLGTQVMVYFLDLDNFKLVNDSLGHTTGDLVLVEVARRLQGALRAGDTVGRLGGDEFVVLCEDVHTEEESDLIAERLRSSVCGPMDIAGYELLPSASLGVARARSGDSAETMLRDADTAMYFAKERGRNRTEAYDDRLRARATRRVEAEAALVEALESNGLRVLYQPIVRASDHMLVGAEALVRCYDPSRGLVPPSEFIPVAEAMGLVNQIDLWMLDQVCRQASRWATLRQGRPLTLSCNVSTRLLALGDLTRHVALAREKHATRPEWIRLELTETALIHGGPKIRRTVEQLREDGVRIGIDDFGTGYSSLTYLRDFPVSFIKLDRTFIEGIDQSPANLAIVESVCALSRALELSVNAEGVETQEQSRALAGLGVQLFQGYLFGPPLSVEQIEGLADGGFGTEGVFPAVH